MENTSSKAIYEYNGKTYHAPGGNIPFKLAIDRVDCNINDEITMLKLYDSATGFLPAEKQAIKAICYQQDVLGKKGVNFRFRRRIGYALKKGFRPKFTVVQIGGK